MAAGWRSLETLRVALQAPETWRDVPRSEWRTTGEVRIPEPDATAAMPDVPAGSFRPNVVVTSSATDEPIEALSARMLAETAGIEGWSRTLAVDLWPYAGVPGRRHEFFYVVGRTPVLVTTHLLLVDAHRVDVTFSRALRDAQLLHELGLGIGSSIRARTVVA